MLLMHLQKFTAIAKSALSNPIGFIHCSDRPLWLQSSPTILTVVSTTPDLESILVTVLDNVRTDIRVIVISSAANLVIL